MKLLRSVRTISDTPLSADAIATLSQVQSWPCASIYLSLDSEEGWAQKGPILLKNALKKASLEMTELRVGSADIDRISRAAYALIDDSSFWEGRHQGLALFMSDNELKAFRLPIKVHETTMIGERFLILPLLPLVGRDGHYYILTLSENEIRLFDATRFTFKEVFVEKMPRSLMDVNATLDSGHDERWHTGSSPAFGGRGRSAMFIGSGSGAESDSKKDAVKKLFNSLEASLASTFSAHPAPLVLAGTASLLQEFREASQLDNILDQEVHGCQDRASWEDIHRSGWIAAEAFFLLAENSAKDRVLWQLASGCGSDKSADICLAASSGRVSTLFVSILGQGSDQGRLSVMNLAAQETLMMSGKVYALPEEEMPTKSLMCAGFRY